MEKAERASLSLANYSAEDLLNSTPDNRQSGLVIVVRSLDDFRIFGFLHYVNAHSLESKAKDDE